MNYYAAVKWPVGTSPKPDAIQLDLEILAIQLVQEHGWSVEQVETVLERAGEALGDVRPE